MGDARVFGRVLSVGDGLDSVVLPRLAAAVHPLALGLEPAQRVALVRLLLPARHQDDQHDHLQTRHGYFEQWSTQIFRAVAVFCGKKPTNFLYYQKLIHNSALSYLGSFVGVFCVVLKKLLISKGSPESCN